MTICDLIITKLELQKVKDREVGTSCFLKASIAEYVLMIICICLALASMDLRILQTIYDDVTGGCPHKGPVILSFDVFFCSWPERTVGQSRCRLFETPWCSCDATVMGMDKSLFMTYWWMFCNCHSRALYDTKLHWTVLKRLLRASKNYKHPPQHIAGGWTDKIATVLPCSVSTIQYKNTYYIYCSNHCLQWPWDRSTFRMSYRSVRNRNFFF